LFAGAVLCDGTCVVMLDESCSSSLFLPMTGSTRQAIFTEEVLLALAWFKLWLPHPASAWIRSVLPFSSNGIVVQSETQIHLKGLLASCHVPHSPIRWLYMLVQSLFNMMDIRWRAIIIDMKELGWKLNNSTIFTTSFKIQSTVDCYIGRNVMVGNSTGDGEGFVGSCFIGCGSIILSVGLQVKIW
jgi:hypothetical protein